MLRNQFRKQTKNTAKNLHLNYQALVVNTKLGGGLFIIFRKSHPYSSREDVAFYELYCMYGAWRLNDLIWSFQGNLKCKSSFNPQEISSTDFQRMKKNIFEKLTNHSLALFIRLNWDNFRPNAKKHSWNVSMNYLLLGEILSRMTWRVQRILERIILRL